jgi:putative membrane protein
VAAALVAHAGFDHVGAGLLAVALIGGYAWAWSRLPRPDGRRLAAWTGAVAALLVANLPSMERLAEERFTGHMVQHLVVIVVAAPLLDVAHPLEALTRAGLVPTTGVGRRIGRWWRTWGVAVGPLAFVTVLFVTHLSDVYDEVLRQRWVHELEHAGYLLGAVLTWSAMLAARPASAIGRVGAAFGVSAAGAQLGVILLTAPEPLIETYAARLGPDALDDQRRAAALMWVSGMLTTVPLLLLAVWRWASAEERATARAEALTDRAPTSS